MFKSSVSFALRREHTKKEEFSTLFIDILIFVLCDRSSYRTDAPSKIQHISMYTTGSILNGRVMLLVMNGMNVSNCLSGNDYLQPIKTIKIRWLIEL